MSLTLTVGGEMPKSFLFFLRLPHNLLLAYSITSINYKRFRPLFAFLASSDFIPQRAFLAILVYVNRLIVSLSVTDKAVKAYVEATSMILFETISILSTQ